MILKKRKRRHSKESHEETESDDEKYIAYVKKSSKKNSSEEKKKTKDSVVDTSSGSSLEKKSKRKKKLEGIDSTIDPNLIVESIDNNASKITSVSIVAKPQINKTTTELNATNEAESNSKGKSKSKKDKSKKSKSKKRSSSIELVEPRKNVISKFNTNPIQNDENKLLLSPASTTSSYLDIDLNMESMVAETNSKKPTNFYTPEEIRDTEDDRRDTKMFKIKSKNKSKSSSDSDEQEHKKKKHKRQQKKKEQKEDHNSATETVQNCNSEIPDTLQEFYDEITRNFEQLTSERSKTDKKKKKSALTVDKSVKDFKDLEDIVKKNTAPLENTNSKNQLVQFFSLESKVILVIKPGTQFSFLGKLKLRVLYGAIKLYGAVFNSLNTLKPVEVYSPRGYSSITITTFSQNGIHDKEALWDVLTSEGVDRSLKTKLHDAITDCTEEWSVLLLENFENTLTNFLNNHCTFKLFPKIENMKYPWCDPKRAEYVLQANFQFCSSGNEISICPQWNENVSKQLLDRWEFSKSLKVMIVGGKSVGKSTTARYLINNLLVKSKKVILLDLDPGQAEMTPAACVSINILEEPLLGPNFTHLKTPFYQLYLEDINVSNCITRYIECVKKLVECYNSRKDLVQYPLIVNTMGFCKGIGLDICIFLIKLIEPSNIIQILSKRPKNNFDFALLKTTINKHKTSTICLEDNSQIFERTCDYELHYVTTMAEGKRQFETWNMEPRQQRELVLLSYLSQIIRNADDKCFCNLTSNSINNIIPYELPFSSFYITLIKSSISPSHILAAMNGNIVALCGVDLDDETSEEDKQSLKYPMVVIKPPPCTCYGYGIVRGVDMDQRKLYVNTPLGEPVLRHVNLLAGCLPLPFNLLHSRTEDTTAPYAADRNELPTSREARRGYFRKSQNKNTA